jgi:hypothetical protein
MNKLLERMWNEAVMAQFEIIFRHFLETLRKSTKNFSHDSRSESGALNQGLDEHETWALTTRKPPSVLSFILEINSIS